MRNDKILFHIKQILHRSSSNFSELWCKLLLNSPKKLSYGITFTNLKDKIVSQRWTSKKKDMQTFTNIEKKKLKAR